MFLDGHGHASEVFAGRVVVHPERREKRTKETEAGWNHSLERADESGTIRRLLCSVWGGVKEGSCLELVFWSGVNDKRDGQLKVRRMELAEAPTNNNCKRTGHHIPAPQSMHAKMDPLVGRATAEFKSTVDSTPQLVLVLEFERLTAIQLSEPPEKLQLLVRMFRLQDINNNQDREI